MRRAAKNGGAGPVPECTRGHIEPGFAPNQLRKLARPLDQQYIHSREVEGRHLSYIEGWYAIAQANEIFGYGSWDREVIFFERTLESVKSDITTCGYIARVRVKARAGSCHVSREGTGWGYAVSRNADAAYERALKSAETDATKRALTTFGPQFGLYLYDKERVCNRKAIKFVLFAPNGLPFADNLSPEAFATGLRQLIEKCRSPIEVSGLIVWNNGSLNGLRINVPDLRNNQGLHFTDLLLRLADRAIRRMEATAPAPSEEARGQSDVPFLPGPPPEVPTVTPASIAPVTIHASASAGPVSIGVGFSDVGSNGGALETPPAAIPDEMRPPAALTLSELTAIESASQIGPGNRIDKSALPIGFERRVRSKLHLKKVAELPCLICNRQPSHAHHVKFAQRRGLSQKVSDEFVVPLCALHHGDLHRATSEQGWWEKQGQEPLAIAAGLWDRFGRNLH